MDASSYEEFTEAINAIAKNAIEFLPRIKDLDVIRSFAGLRPYSPDGLPILGAVKGIKGFFLATGHSGDGVSLAPITGKVSVRSRKPKGL